MAKSIYLKFSVKWIIYILFISFISVFVYYRIHKNSLQNNQFDIRKISSRLEYDPLWEVASLEEYKNVDQVLDQDFFYCGKGKQFYAFSSQDDKYILKLFKCNRLETPEWLNLLSFLPFIKPYFLRQTKKIYNRRCTLFSSCKLAFEELKNETGLLYIHLNKTNVLNKKIKISDHLNRQYLLNIDDYQFLLQKKAALICPSLQIAMLENNFSKAKKYIDELLALIITRQKKGIVDNDPCLINNSGFLENQAIHIDVGRFAKYEDIKNPEIAKEMIYKITEELKLWIYDFYPDLGIYFDEQLNRLCMS